ncbi:MAG: S8 family peptidase [Candidatus Omnitrophota bacterium]|nr:S8 family peptidase [Candidatus Omnitrophota bacterium]
MLETVGAVDNLIVAVRGIPGLEWLGEIEEEDIPPDDDFFVAAPDGTARLDKALRGRVFLVFTNQQALRQMLSLWESWKQGQALPYGFSKWTDLFFKLRDVRPWGVRDRLEETGVLADWQERVSHNEEVIPCELELWFRGSAQRRQAARGRVANLVSALQGQVLHEATIEEISYHALLVRLPVAAVRQVLDQAGRDTALVQCEQIQFFRATGQMSGIVRDDTRFSDTGTVPTPPDQLGDPVVALLDGLPLQNHRRLAGRLTVDDPDGYEQQYPAVERQHGTTMASLILHGDLDAGEAPLNRRLYVRPILRPDHHAWRQPRQETAPEDKLLIDLVYRAVRRLFEGEDAEPAVAPQICVINLSIGIRDRLFEGALSPLARLLDWLSWKYRVLFIVSAGNHQRGIELNVPHGQLTGLSPQDIQDRVIRAVAADARHRRLLSPAEAVNVLTVGAVHHDSSSATPVPRAIQPFIDEGLPSIVNAQGMGYRRAIKPDVLLPGGRVVLLENGRVTSNALLDIYTLSLPPGHRAASPGTTPGEADSLLYTRGTSNATALASRASSQLYNVLDDLRSEQGGTLIDNVPRALWLKALLVHAASWGNAGDILEQILRTPQNSRQFKEYVTRLLGYGTVATTRVMGCTQFQVTALGGGQLQVDQAHIHRLPLPPSLSGKRGRKRLIVTLAWFTPVNPTHQAWRRAALWFNSPSTPLQVDRQEANWQAVQRGTVQHEILEGDRASAFVDGDNIEILVSCRSDAGTLEEAVPYAIAITLEIAEEIGIDIYNEVRVRIQPTQIDIAPRG